MVFRLVCPSSSPDQFVSARVGVKDYFCAQMSELVRRHFYSQVPQDRLVYCIRNRRLAPRFARFREEDNVGTLADHGRCVSLR